jgi:hypothetical protein
VGIRIPDTYIQLLDFLIQVIVWCVLSNSGKFIQMALCGSITCPEFEQPILILDWQSNGIRLFRQNGGLLLIPVHSV